MKDSHKKIGSVVLAGSMLLGGTLQPGTFVANADDNVQQDSNTIMGVYDINDAIKDVLKNKYRFDYMWKPDLEKPKNFMQKLLYDILTQDNEYKDKIDVIACGSSNIVSRIASQITRQIQGEEYLDFKIEHLWYRDLVEFKTGKYIRKTNQPVERVVNRVPIDQSVGLPSIHQLHKGKIYYITIESHNADLLIYVKK